MWTLAVIFCTFLTTVLSQTTNIEFYMHDNLFVPNPSAIAVAGPNGSSTNTLTFGTVIVIDDLLTEGSSSTSRSLGRGQGTYLVAAQDSSTLLLTFTAVFSDRNGTLSFHGADKVTDPTREIAVVGGTGTYRFAQGYALISTYSSSGPSVVLHFNVSFDIKASSSSTSPGSSPSSTSSSSSSSSSPGEKSSSTSPSYFYISILIFVLSLLHW